MTLGARKAPMRRGKGLKKSGRIKPKRRSAKAFARIYGSVERVEWIKSRGCHLRWSTKSCGPCEGEIQNAHAVSGGKGYKASAEWIVPLCVRHHRLYDEYKAPFDTEYGRAQIIGAAAAYDLAFSTRNGSDETN